MHIKVTLRTVSTKFILRMSSSKRGSSVCWGCDKTVHNSHMCVAITLHTAQRGYPWSGQTYCNSLSV